MTSELFINPHRKHRKQSVSFPTLNPNIRAFHQSLPDYAVTPLHSLPSVARHIGVKNVLLKDESFRLGLPAFKILGASWATVTAITKRLNLAPEALEKDHDNPRPSLEPLASAAKAERLVLFAATDGNHGRAVARMAKYLGIQARIFVPRILDEEAKDNIKSEGAVVEVCDGDYDRTVLATKVASENYPGGKGLLISDTALVYGDETAQWIVDGYQTMFDEVEEQLNEVGDGKVITHVLSPVGVGSLTQAVVTHFTRSSWDKAPTIITVEPIEAACFHSSLKKGKIVSVDTGYTICSGLCCGTLSYNGWPILRDGVAASVTVDDRNVEKAMKELDGIGISAGPCGAATLAGLRAVFSLGAAGLEFDERSTVLIICTEGTRGYELR